MRSNGLKLLLSHAKMLIRQVNRLAKVQESFRSWTTTAIWHIGALRDATLRWAANWLVERQGLMAAHELTQQAHILWWGLAIKQKAWKINFVFSFQMELYFWWWQFRQCSSSQRNAARHGRSATILFGKKINSWTS